MKYGQTPSQTVGPYFAYGLTPEQYGYPYRSAYRPVLVDERALGERVVLTGRVFDGDGKPVDDAMIEISHVDARGQHLFGRCGTGTERGCSFRFQTVKPASTGPGAAPHIDVIVMMRGLLSHAFTRIYFDDEAEANARDELLAEVPVERRSTLLARREELPVGAAYRFDIRMQGPEETVFFDL